jgi:DNA-binding NarL/FixJ family response regulator
VSRKIGILLVDDHGVVREGIRSYLLGRKQFKILGEAVDGREALAKVKQLKPDVVLLDINLPKMNGLMVTERLRSEAPNTKILVLTVHNNREYVSQIVRSGARGYVLKDASPEDLVRAIETVHRGHVFFSQSVAQVLLQDVDSPLPDPSNLQPRLSSREREVLGLIAGELSNKEIAAQLKIGVRTVETHRERIMRKLNIHTVAGLTKFAIANGLLSLD